MNGQASSEPKLIFPGLAGFYDAVSDLWYPMIRIAAGGSLLFHGWGKIAAGQFTVAPSLVKYGIGPADRWAISSSFSKRLVPSVSF